MTSDALASALAAIRDRAEGITASHADEDCDGPDPCTGHDALRMAKALRAALELTAEFNVEDGHYPDPGMAPVSRADRIRAVIEQELTGGASHDR